MGIGQRGLRASCSAIAVLGMSVVVAACGGSGGSGSSAGGSGGSGGSGSNTVKVGAILIGPKNDRSFSQSAYDGIRDAEKEHPNIKLTAVLENKTDPQQVADAVNTLAPINDVVVGVTSLMGPVFDQLADKYPNTVFIQIDGYSPHYHKNVIGWANDWGSPVYVAGMAAAHMTKTGVVGFVGGAETATGTQSKAAFASGAKHADPNVKTLLNLTGDYDDVAKAKSATSAMLADNADVILAYLDSGTAGAYAAGKESGKNPAMIHITTEDCTQYGNIVGNVVGNNELATKEMLDRYLGGKLDVGVIFTDLQEPELQTFKLCPKYKDDQGLVKVVKDAVQAIDNGQIKLPANELWPRPDYPYKEGFDGQVQNAGKSG